MFFDSSLRLPFAALWLPSILPAEFSLFAHVAAGKPRVGDLPIEPYDVLMLAVLVLATLFGLWKGMAWQIASLASLVVSCLVALRCSGPLAPYISDHEPWNRFLAMLILYLATSLAIWLAFRLVAGVIDRVRLKEFDRQMGAFFGLAKGILLCLVITFFFVTLSENARQSVLRSRSGKYIALLIQQATPAMPDEVRNVLGKYIQELDEKLDPDTPPEPPRSQRAAAKPRPESEIVEDQVRGLGTQITERWKARFEARLDEGADRLDEGIDALKEKLDDRLQQGVDRLEQGLETIEDRLDDRVSEALEAVPKFDFGRPPINPSFASTLVALPGYRIKPADVLEIELLKQTPRPLTSIGATGPLPDRSIDGLYRVEADGTIDLRQYGKVQVADKTLTQAERDIQQHLATFFAAAEVSLEVAADESEVYYIILDGAGQGDTVWRVPCDGSETVQTAVRIAAGSPRRSIANIWIARPSVGGAGYEQVLPIRWNATTASASPNYQLGPGDAVFVAGDDSRTAANVRDWVTAWFDWIRR